MEERLIGRMTAAGEPAPQINRAESGRGAQQRLLAHDPYGCHGVPEQRGGVGALELYAAVLTRSFPSALT